MQISLQLFALICLGLLITNAQYIEDSIHDRPLHVAYEWKEIDFEFLNMNQRLTAIQRGIFIPENVVPFGLEVYEDRVFVTLPRWKNGVPASLAYFNIGESNKSDPILNPYPSWEAHNLMSETSPEIVSPFRVRADRCGRLWVLDSRISGVLESPKFYGPTQLLVYDIHNDTLLRRHIFPANHVKQSSLFSSLAVEDTICENTYVYAGDLGNPGLVVYSWSDKDSWRVQHNFFHPDPLAGNFSIDSIDFQWDDGVYGLALSKASEDNRTLLFFHPLSSTLEFVVDTDILHNKTQATSTKIYYEFKQVMSRGVNGQAGASFLYKNTDNTNIIFFALPNLNAVACWKTENPAFALENNVIYENATSLSFPSDIVVDEKDRIWILSNRLHQFIYSRLDANTSNFRILTGDVREIIKNSACSVETDIETIFKMADFEKNTGNMRVKTGNNILKIQKLLPLTVLGIYLFNFNKF